MTTATPSFGTNWKSEDLECLQEDVWGDPAKRTVHPVRLGMTRSQRTAAARRRGHRYSRVNGISHRLRRRF